MGRTELRYLIATPGLSSAAAVGTSAGNDGWTPAHSASKYGVAWCGCRYMTRRVRLARMLRAWLRPFSRAGAIVGVDLAKNVFQLCVADAASARVETQPEPQPVRALVRQPRRLCVSSWKPAVRPTTGRAGSPGWNPSHAPCSRYSARLRPSATRPTPPTLRLCSKPRAAPSRNPRASSVHRPSRRCTAPQPVAGPHAAHQHPARPLPRVRHRYRPGPRASGSSRSPGVAEPRSGILELLRPTMVLLVEECACSRRASPPSKRELTALVRHSPACTTLLSVPGIGC